MNNLYDKAERLMDKVRFGWSREMTREEYLWVLDTLVDLIENEKLHVEEHIEREAR